MNLKEILEADTAEDIESRIEESEEEKAAAELQAKRDASKYGSLIA
ncbi:hypothetical protein [Halonotius roseus]|nr:hypothetical protein [Halonotius roseus]